MSNVTNQTGRRSSDRLPDELVRLMERVRSLPYEVRIDLEPLVGDAMEQAIYRSRVMTLAREALERFRLDLTMLQFDLDVTRRERQELQDALRSPR